LRFRAVGIDRRAKPQADENKWRAMMATVTTPQSFDHAGTQKSVRHPLQIVRGYIRQYIILEGLALTLLCAALVFWIGLAFDFGLYLIQVDGLKIYGIDWIQELNDIDSTGVSSLGVRIIFLTVVVVGLAALGFTKVVMRWMREFNDQAIALVLERRFHRELGDRLITAIELADPKLSKKYGFSQQMVEKTIADAIVTLKKLPVADVFNWARLRKLWALVAFASIGMVLVVMALSWSGSAAYASVVDSMKAENEEQPAKPIKVVDPIAFSWKFYDTASIWAERNVLMMNTYWPRRAHLVVEGFQRSKDKEDVMRVARDDVRPELHVRAIQYVIADRTAPAGWRALTWNDLSKHKLVDAALLSGVNIPVEFPDWVIDPDELEPNLSAALFGNETTVRKNSDIDKYLSQPTVARKILDLQATEQVAQWRNWREWTMDKLALQIGETEVRTPLRNVNSGKDHDNLDAIFKQIDVLADAPSMSRTLRKLEVPSTVEVIFRGEESGYRATYDRQIGNKFTVPLEQLKDSTNFKFRARGEDYYTPPKTITLVAAPTPSNISIDKEEPAYIYHRLPGIDQAALRGLKHRTIGLGLSTTGDMNTIEVPLGSSLVVHVKTDRQLRQDKGVFVNQSQVLEPGFEHYKGKAAVRDDMGFSFEMHDIQRKHDFTVEYFDEDNIRGRRRFKIISVLDTEPQMGNLNVYSALLRKPKFKAPTPGEKDKEQRDTREQTELAGAFLVTPDALIPFECAVKDDYGLVRAGYHYKVREVDFELSSGGSKKLPTLQVNQTTRLFRARLALTPLQFLPSSPVSWYLAPGIISNVSDRFTLDLLQSQGYRESYVPAEGFQDLVERRKDRFKDIESVKNLLTKTRSSQSWEWDFKDDLGFDLRKYMPELKAVDIEKTGQTHYYVQIAVQSSDNNVETGSDYPVFVSNENPNVETGPTYVNDKGKIVPAKVRTLMGNTKKNKNGYIGFIVISENDLLSQIALQEEELFEKLDAAKERVDAGITTLSAQAGKIGDANVDMDIILNRMNEVRVGLVDAGAKLRDAEQAYKNIVREMEVNRIDSKKLSKIRDGIHWPIKNILEPNPIAPGSGSYPATEDTFQRVIQLVEDDVNAKRAPNVAQHRTNMLAANRDFSKLSYDLKLVLDAMNEGIVESKLIALLASIEEAQRKKSRELKAFYDKQLQDLLEKLLEGEKKEPEKKEPMKSSSLPGAIPSLADLRIHYPALAARLDARIARLEPALQDNLRRTLQK